MISLELATTSLPDTRIAQQYSQTLSATGGKLPYSFSMVSGELPVGMNLLGSGVITGLAGSPGRSAFTVQVKDAAGTTDAQDLTIWVEPDALEIGAIVLPMGREGAAYSEQLVSRGGMGRKTWSLGQGALPAGITLSPEGAIAGTPSAYGVFDFTVVVTDENDRETSRDLHLTVISLSPMMETASLVKGRLGEPYNVAFEANGGLPPYSWTIQVGALPDGMNLSTDGTLAGTPTESGDFPISVRVTDATNHGDARDMTLRIIAPLAIVTTQLNQAIHDRPYLFDLQATGGEPPYVWELATGSSLPAGITFNATGRFSGSTSRVGDNQITVRVRDTDGFMQSALFTLRVSDRFTFDAQPVMSLPATCTGTTVAFTAAELLVTDSMAIEDLDVSVNIVYPNPDDLKIMIEAPHGERATLCGAESWSGCTAQEINRTYDDDGAQANRPDSPLSHFDGYNPQGRWRLIVLVLSPSCAVSGTINSFSLTIQDDRSTNPYIAVRGYSTNNLIHEPFVRIDDVNVPGDGVDEHELYLSATLYEVGANGYREGGIGDDVVSGVPLTWSWLGTPIPGTTLESDGYVHAGETCGMSQIVATASGETITFMLRVVPPDWQPAR